MTDEDFINLLERRVMDAKREHRLPYLDVIEATRLDDIIGPNWWSQITPNMSGRWMMTPYVTLHAARSRIAEKVADQLMK